MLATDIEVDLLLIAQMDERPPCEDEDAHRNGESYHDPAQRAAFLMLNPCHGERLLICYSRAFYLKHKAPTIRCHLCKTDWPPSAYRFIPIADDVPAL